MNVYTETPKETARIIAANFRLLRKRKKISMKTLSEKSGVSYSSVKRFERTGEVSLVSLVAMASVLEAEEEIRSLFEADPPQTLEEVRRDIEERERHPSYYADIRREF